MHVCLCVWQSSKAPLASTDFGCVHISSGNCVCVRFGKRCFDCIIEIFCPHGLWKSAKSFQPPHRIMCATHGTCLGDLKAAERIASSGEELS